MSESYCAIQSRRDAQYVAEYSAWISTLQPRELEQARSMGLDAPMLSRHGNGAPERDMADSPLSSHTPDIAQLVDEYGALPDERDQSACVMAHAARMLRVFVADVLSEPNTRLTVECLAVALRLSAYDGESMSSIAARHGVTRAAVSKRCVDITKKLALPPSRAMRSLKAREVYRKSQIHKSKYHDGACCYS